MTDRSRQLVLDLPLRPALSREDFLVTPSNQAAVALIDQWPQWPGPAALIIGPAGSGKSHLVEVWRQRSGAARAPLAKLTIDEIPTLMESGSLALEDADCAPVPETALFHALNLARQQKGHVLLTAQSRPEAWQVTLRDLATRLFAVPSIAILPPDDTLLRGVLIKHFADRQIAVDEQVVAYLIARMPRSLESARSLVERIDRQALEERAEVTRPFVARVLADFESPGFI
jgi:chromosomal replication initiation ATPase DnaA